MNGKQETIGDIVAEYRKDAHLMERHQLPEPTVGDLRILLDRIEAAADRLASKMNALSRDLWNGKKMGEFAFALALDSFESALSATTAPAKSKVESTQPKSGWNVPAALNFANTLANHGWTQTANADSASSCIYALCRMLKERGNAAAMREAVKAVVDVGYPHNFQREAPHIRGYCYDITKAVKKCFAALSAPPRNCDVGTAQKQYRRFIDECNKRDCRQCSFCPNRRYLTGGRDECFAVWAEMPYEERGAE